MATGISIWSTVASANGTLGSTPTYWPEGQAPSTVNDCARAMMKSIREKWNDAQWFDWGYTVVRTGGGSFTVVTAGWNTVTVANVFETGGRIRLHDTSTMYGTITTVSVSAASVQVSFTPDSGSLTASFSSVYNSIITADQNAIPSAAVPADVVRQSGAQIYAADAGVSDAYAITLSPAITSYVAGQAFNFFANTANTTGATLEINGLGPKAITFPDGSALTTGTIAAGQIVRVVYDGTQFQMQSINSSGGGGASAATQAEIEAGTITTSYVSPGRQQYHNSANKFWVIAGINGTIVEGYNVSSVTDTGTGIVTINFTTSFSSTAYTVCGIPHNTVGGSAASTYIINIRTAIAVGSFIADCVNASTFAGTDPGAYFFQGCGDL